MENRMINSTAANPAFTSTGGDFTPSNTITWPNYTNWNYNWASSYGYATEAQVAELRGKVDVLEKMVAVLLSGIKTGSSPRKAKRA